MFSTPNSTEPLRTIGPLRPDSDAVREAQAHLGHFPAESRDRWLRVVDGAFNSFAAEKRYNRRIWTWGSSVATSQWIPIGGGTVGPKSDADVLHDPDFQKNPGFESLLQEISEERALSILVVTSLLIDRDAAWHDARSVNVGAAHLATYRPVLAKQQHQAYRKRVERRKAGSKGGKAKAEAYAPARDWILSNAERLNLDRTQSHDDKMTFLFSNVPPAVSGKKPSRSAIYRWLKRANIAL